MGLAARRLKEDVAEGIARALALLGRVRFPPPEVRAAQAKLREVSAPPVPKPKPTDERQVPLELPERKAVDSDALVRDCPLGTDDTRACVCVARQLANEIKSGLVLGTKRRGKGGKSETARKRGVSREYPSCVTELCAVGRRVRAQIGDDPAAKVKHGQRRDQVALYEARLRQERVTVEVPTIDDHLGDEPG